MSFYRGMTCENITIHGDSGTPITAYVAKPEGPGPFPGRNGQGARVGGRYVEGCRYVEKVSWFVVFGFLVSWSLVSWFQSFLVSKIKKSFNAFDRDLVHIIKFQFHVC